jgi:predicted DNA-binding protein
MKKERLPELHVLSKTIGRTDTSWIKKVENLIEIAGDFFFRFEPSLKQ